MRPAVVQCRASKIPVEAAVQDISRNGSVVELNDPATASRAALPVMVPTIGPEMIDVRGIKQATGRYVFDPGLTATGICRSAITYVDGDNGVLLYRGYPIDQLVERSDFLEVAWLLLDGELPSVEQKQKFVADVTHHT